MRMNGRKQNIKNGQNSNFIYIFENLLCVPEINQLSTEASFIPLNDKFRYSFGDINDERNLFSKLEILTKIVQKRIIIINEVINAIRYKLRTIFMLI